MTGEPVLYDPETDTLLVELRPWPAASPAEANEQAGGEDAEEGLVVHYGLDGLPHAFEIEHASQPPRRLGRVNTNHVDDEREVDEGGEHQVELLEA